MLTTRRLRFFLLATSSGGRLGWFRDILPQMNAIITLSFDAARAQLAPAGTQFTCFTRTKVQMNAVNMLALDAARTQLAPAAATR